MNITVNTKIQDTWNMTGLAVAAPFYIGGNKEWYERLKQYSFSDVQKECPTWQASDMAYGVARLAEIAAKGKPYLYDVYDDNTCADDPHKSNVKLFNFPGKIGMPFVIVCAGGGFGAVASLAEAFPVAARFNEYGYNVFCLNYRTCEVEDNYFAIVPKALDDLAAALRFITSHANKFGVDAMRYGVCGFSAGGHLCSEWGNPMVGYKAHGGIKPEILMPIYGIMTADQYSGENVPEIWRLMSKVMYGVGEHNLDDYDILKSLGKEYPMTYLVHARDDMTVSVENSEKMSQVLHEKGIAHISEIVPIGGHGFGLGSGTSAAGWLDRAVQFWENLKRS